MPNNANRFSQIKRSGVVEDILDLIKHSLIEGNLRPGDRLPAETELAHSMGVSRGAVREAMKMLAAMGVVDIKQGDGTYISDGQSASLLNPLVFAILLNAGLNSNLLELRALIEVGYCQLAAQKAEPADWDRIEKAAKAFEEYTDTPNYSAAQLTKLDLEFHYTLLDATHNPQVITIGRAVEELFFGSIQQTLSQYEGVQGGVEGHRQILDSMRSKNTEAIREAVVQSLERWGQELKKRGKL